MTCYGIVFFFLRMTSSRRHPGRPLIYDPNIVEVKSKVKDGIGREIFVCSLVNACVRGRSKAFKSTWQF